MPVCRAPVPQGDIPGPKAARGILSNPVRPAQEGVPDCHGSFSVCLVFAGGLVIIFDLHIFHNHAVDTDDNFR